jgi:endonuclease III
VKRLLLLREIDGRLARSYTPTRLGNPRDPLNDLIFLLLSAQTEEYNYRRTYANLRRKFPTWSALLSAGVEPTYDAIRIGGLGRKKAQQLVALISELVRRHGKPTLSHLRRLGDEDAIRELEALPGVGPKTARCVMAYALGRQVLPIDTHVWRTLRRLGFAPNAPATTRRARAVEAAVPEQLRYRLHVNLVLLGRETCTSVRPHCGACPLEDLCPKIGVVTLPQQPAMLVLHRPSAGGRVRRTKVGDRSRHRREGGDATRRATLQRPPGSDLRTRAGP